MPKDATPDSIVLRNSNFANDNHEKIAEILEREWDASAKFSELGDRFDIAHRATFQKVYNEYFGVPEDLFGDGVDDKRTIEQIKDEHGRMKEYMDLRAHGQLDPEDYRNVEWLEGFEPEEEQEMIEWNEHMVKTQEAYRKGYRDAMQDMQEQ